jgi:PAS domain S-box-containing protein
MTDKEKSSGETPYELAYLRALVADLENKNRQSEELLQILTDQYRRITEVVSDYIFSVHIIDGNPVETIHGRGCLSITGYSPEEFVASSFLWINMVFDDDRGLVLRHVAGILSGKDTAAFEHRIVRKDGVVRWVRNTPVCQYDTSGKLIAYDGLIQDITDRRQTEEALHDSEEKYRLIADFTYDWEEWLGPDRRYIYVSPSCKHITGYDREDFIADPDLVIAIAHPADRPMVVDHYNKVENSDAKTGALEFRIITMDGEERWISHSCQPVFGGDGRWLGRRASNRDISRSKYLMGELLKARELEAVGILAGGIAHDFNNLITAILGNISVAKMNINPDNKIYPFLSGSEEASIRASELTKQLLAFSRRGMPVKSVISANEMLTKIADGEHDGNGIKYNFIIPDYLWTITADEGQIIHAVRNLIINAKEAMAHKGLITVIADNLTVSASDKLALVPGDYIRISVHDTGVGIPPENITRLFDPYFTTKTERHEKGVGLGLAIAHSIVANHNGIINIESEPGKGSTLHIYLPAEK